MESRASKALRLYKFVAPDLLSTEGSILPEAYKKFYREWKQKKPSPVHYVPHTTKWVRNDETGEVKRIENVPIPLHFPPESHHGIWGGEGVIKGFQKRQRTKARVPHFWVPNLKKSAVRSEILAQVMSVTLTERTIDLIFEHKGFDNYILRTSACDLQSGLALKLKQMMLSTLLEKKNNPDAPLPSSIYDKYKHFLEQYTPEEIDWYGLTFDEALMKRKAELAVENAPKPLKHQYRAEFLERLKHHQQSAQEIETATSEEKSSWLSKINPFSKKS